MKSTPDNIQFPKTGEPIRESFLKALTERGKNPAFPRGIAAGGMRAQCSDPPPFDFSKIRIQNNSDNVLNEGEILQLADMVSSPVRPEDFFRLNTPPKRVFHGIVPESANADFAIVQSNVPPGGVCNALISGYSIAKIHINDEEDSYAIPMADSVVLESCPEGPVHILTRTSANADSVAFGFVRFEFSGTSAFEVLEKEEELFTSESSFEPEYDWILPAGCVVRRGGGLIRDTFLPELHGTLNEESSGGSERPVDISLPDGETFQQRTQISALPAHNIPEGTAIPAGTPVVVKWNPVYAKWFFFIVRTGGGAGTRFNVSGTALGGFGTYDEKTIWATQLSIASEGVNDYNTIAILETVEAIASEDDTPWLKFSVRMTGAENETQPEYVRGKYYKEKNKYRIYLKDDFGTIYLNNSGTEYKPTFRTFNGEPVWKDSYSNYLYYDGYGRWMEGDLGTIHTLPPEEDPFLEGGEYGALSIGSLGFSEKSKPYWECSSEYGEYQPMNGASGVLIFGTGSWSVIGDVESTFLRSLKKNEGYFTYHGTVLVDETSYNNIQYQAWKWVLGTFGSRDGWYVGSELSPQMEVAFIFQTPEPLADIVTTSADILLGEVSVTMVKDVILDSENHVFRIPDSNSKIGSWELAVSAADSYQYSFEFEAPENSDEILAPKIVTLTEILEKTAPEIEYDSVRERFVITNIEASEGLWAVPKSTLSENVTFRYTFVSRESLSFIFSGYVKGEYSDEIWSVTPEIIT
ncbi:MAG: hypothetical protein IJD43_04865 [Thermoguttaceae bacterium]|nr:hypothetical protein [Thermoguttaceae bacterium]